MIAIAFVHEEPKVRSKAMAWIKKYVADAAELKSVFKDLPKEVGQLPNLKKLWIRWSKIDADQARAIIGTNVQLEA